MTIEIRSTLREAPIRVCIAGRDGLGKSTWAAAAPKAIFIAVENGLDNIDARSVMPPKKWSDVVAAVEDLATHPECGSIVIDSLDWAEQLCWKHVCEIGDDKGKKPNIEAFGYGKGYVAALNEWRVLLEALSRARANGRNIILIAHAERKAVKNPTGDDYDAWSIKLNAKAAGLIREWVDVVGFAELDMALVEQDGRQKGISNGKRILRTQPHPGYETKTRFNLPAKIPLDWRAFAAAVAAGKPPTVEQLRKTLHTKLTSLAREDIASGCKTFLEERGESFASLTEAIATVEGYLAEKAEEKKAG